ncbi:MAG: hypothetical protein AAF420_16185 [Pseudomonadota bacterium]
MFRLGALLLLGASFSTSAHANVIHYTVSGFIASDAFVDLSIGGVGDFFSNDAIISDNNGNLIDALAGQPFTLSFSQDKSAPISGDFGKSARYANAILNFSFQIDGQSAATAPNEAFFGSTNIVTQHQWSIFSGGSDNPTALVDDGFLIADYSFDLNGELTESSVDVFWEGVDLIGLDKELSLFQNDMPPENAPFFSDSFDGPTDSIFAGLNWTGFDVLDIDGLGPVDVQVDFGLDLLVTDYTSTAVIPVPGALYLMGVPVFALMMARGKRRV